VKVARSSKSSDPCFHGTMHDDLHQRTDDAQNGPEGEICGSE
jgi:hypothetical protein